MHLTPRLQAVLSFIDCEVLADIGADHALIPVAACLSGQAGRAFACDIRPGPLERAKRNILHHTLENSVETRLGGGLSVIKKNEADCIVIAGMGGLNIIEIVTEGRETALSAKKLILQPQRDAVLLRKALHNLGFEIGDETIARENDRFYPVLTAKPCQNVKNWTEKEYIAGKHNIARNSAVFRAWLKHEIVKISAYKKRTSATESLLKTYEELLCR